MKVLTFWIICLMKFIITIIINIIKVLSVMACIYYSVQCVFFFLVQYATKLVQPPFFQKGELNNIETQLMQN